MSDVKPALSPEQWEAKETGPREDDWPWDPRDGAVRLDSGGGEEALCVYGEGGFRYELADRHATAALALHGQSYGFTWEDVDLLREAHITRRDPTSFQGTPVLDKGATERLHAVADRIAALLPPREEP